MITDAKSLLENISKGDNEAFRTLFDAFFPKVKVFLVKFLKDDKLAEDIAQDIFAKVWTMRASLPEIRSFNTYLYRMTKNSALNYFRDRKTIVDISELAILDDADIEQEYYSKEKELLIRLIVDQMPVQRRNIFMMSRYQGMSNEEIATNLSISKHTVENNLSISLKELREVMLAFILFFLN